MPRAKVASNKKTDAKGKKAHNGVNKTVKTKKPIKTDLKKKVKQIASKAASKTSPCTRKLGPKRLKEIDPVHSKVPDELWLKLLSYLDIVSIFKMGATSRRYNNISKDPTLWKNLEFDWESVRLNVPAIEAILDRATKLEKIEFTNENMWLVDDKILTSLIVKAKESLKVLTLGVKMMTKNVTVKRFELLKKLEVLNLHMDTRISPEGERITRVGVNAIAKLKNLKELRIPVCDKLKEKDLIHLFNELENLVVVDLTTNDMSMHNWYKYRNDITALTDASVKILARNNPNLEHLNLCHMQHTYTSSDFWAYRHTQNSTLKELAQNCPKLHHLDATRLNENSLSALVLFKNLRYLKLDDTHLSDDLLHEIAKNNSSLTELSLRWNENCSGGVRSVIQYCPNIKKIFLPCFVSTEVIKEVLVAFEGLIFLGISEKHEKHQTKIFINNLKKKRPSCQIICHHLSYIFRNINIF